MIVGADTPQIVGQRYEGAITDRNRQWQSIPYVILREATREEWEAELRATHPEAEEEIRIARYPAWFYEVSVD